ncbi:hypothetical protein IG631_06094 [Alternaria alternata]|nr:hypothetical protein IG631_06094 [Alternaria alternata]
MGNIQGCYTKGKLNECKDEGSASTQIGTYTAVYDNSALLPVRDLFSKEDLRYPTAMYLQGIAAYRDVAEAQRTSAVLQNSE